MLQGGARTKWERDAEKELLTACSERRLTAALCRSASRSLSPACSLSSSSLLASRSSRHSSGQRGRLTAGVAVPPVPGGIRPLDRGWRRSHRHSAASSSGDDLLLDGAGAIPARVSRSRHRVPERSVGARERVDPRQQRATGGSGGAAALLHALPPPAQPRRGQPATAALVLQTEGAGTGAGVNGRKRDYNSRSSSNHAQPMHLYAAALFSLFLVSSFPFADEQWSFFASIQSRMKQLYCNNASVAARSRSIDQICILQATLDRSPFNCSRSLKGVGLQ